LNIFSTTIFPLYLFLGCTHKIGQTHEFSSLWPLFWFLCPVDSWWRPRPCGRRITNRQRFLTFYQGRHLNLKKKYFFVFLSTKYFLHILFPPPWRKLKWRPCILLPVTFYFNPSTRLDNVKNLWRFVIS